ncbi:mechanosensitive ion channel family protein [Chitinibacteraceae bacterium HSL-7]
MTPLESLRAETLLSGLVREFDRFALVAPHMLRQYGVIVLAIALAWLVNRYLKPRLGLHQSRWRFGGDALTRVFFPLLAAVMLFAGAFVLRQIDHQPPAIVRVAMTLMIAMFNIRVVVYLLRSALPNASWLASGERYIAGTIWAIYALHLFGVLGDIRQELDEIALPLGSTKISLLDVTDGLLSVAVTSLMAMWIGRLIERRLMSATMLDMNVRVVGVKVTQSLLVVLAVIVALSLVGIDLTVLSVFGGALGVGLGFGLQKIASNYVSGFIILLDRSVKLGDLIQIDGRQGTVSGLTSRYIVLKSMDGTESLVPNETLITSTVINQSYNARDVWVKLPVSVAYETDLELVKELLVATTREQERIAAEPPPRAYIENFGASGVDMSLGFWVRDPENGTLGLKSDLYTAIWQAFREHGITIPFNRLDVVHFKPAVRQAGDGNLYGLVEPDDAGKSG